MSNLGPMHVERLETLFYKHIPSPILPGKIYFSREYKITNHICPCGCGREVPVPVLLNDVSNDLYWGMTINKNLITLNPSLRSRSCGAHYFIRDNKFILCADHKPYKGEPIK